MDATLRPDCTAWDCHPAALQAAFAGSLLRQLVQRGQGGDDVRVALPALVGAEPLAGVAAVGGRHRAREARQQLLGTTLRHTAAATWGRLSGATAVLSHRSSLPVRWWFASHFVLWQAVAPQGATATYTLLASMRHFTPTLTPKPWPLQVGASLFSSLLPVRGHPSALHHLDPPGGWVVG